jgi:hypothetical protein
MWPFKKKRNEERIEYGIEKYICHTCDTEVFKINRVGIPALRNLDCQNHGCESRMTFINWYPGLAVVYKRGPWVEKTQNRPVIHTPKPIQPAPPDITAPPIQPALPIITAPPDIMYSAEDYNRTHCLMYGLLEKLKEIYLKVKNTPKGLQEFQKIKDQVDTWAKEVRYERRN